MQLLGLLTAAVLAAICQASVLVPASPRELRVSGWVNAEAREYVEGEFRGPSRNLPELFERQFRGERVFSDHPLKLNSLFYKGKDGDWPRSPQEMAKKDPKWEGLKVVLGIMAFTPQAEIRNAHRRTWMSAPGVCSLLDREKDGCHVFPVFVYGNVSGKDLERTDDALILRKVAEPRPNMSSSGYRDELTALHRRGATNHDSNTAEMYENAQFKTPEFFRYAAKNFPWASHVGKMDLDSYPFIDIMQSFWARAPRRGVYDGRFFKGSFAGLGGMYGGMYTVTSDLLECWIHSVNCHACNPHVMFRKKRNETQTGPCHDCREKQSIWTEHPEDALFGYFLYHADTGSCAEVEYWMSGYYKHPV